MSNLFSGDPMIRLAAFAAILSLSTSLAMAQDFDPVEGLYTGNGEGELSAEFSHIESDVYAFSISTSVPMENDIPGCGGGIEGEVVIRDNVGLFSAPNELYDATSDLTAFNTPQCQIRLEFDDNYGLVVTEEAGCTYYHGAACGFSGQLLHEAAGI